MIPELFWIDDIKPLRLAMMARPRSDDWLLDEIAGWRLAGVKTVVSLLEPREASELRLADEAAICAEFEIEFLTYPVRDRGTPASVQATVELVDDVISRLRKGNAVAIHCRAGIGRSGLLAACVLARLHVRFEDIFPVLSKARKLSVPDTQDQINWVKRFADTQKGGQ